jgi:2-methylisocitrate lyase-like PEP mutase family enzyme
MSTLFEALLREDRILVLPGAFDALSARIAVRAGARAVYMTGFGVVGASWGVPDIGLIGPEAMTERVRAIAGAITPVPLVADGDNGHGGPANVARLVNAYEQAGAVAIQLEDQVMPKRCGHMEGKEIVSFDDSVAKIRAACEARHSPDFKIVARTDARAVEGLDEAMRRGEAFLKAGADILFIEAPQSEDELRIVAKTFAGTPLMANMVEDGKTPWLSPAVLRDMGYRIALYPITALLIAARALEEVYEKTLSGHAHEITHRMSFKEFTGVVGLVEAKKLHYAASSLLHNGE